jgi:hypothetical protein
MKDGFVIRWQGQTVTVNDKFAIFRSADTAEIFVETALAEGGLAYEVGPATKHELAGGFVFDPGSGISRGGGVTRKKHERHLVRSSDVDQPEAIVALQVCGTKQRAIAFLRRNLELLEAGACFHYPSDIDRLRVAIDQVRGAKAKGG